MRFFRKIKDRLKIGEFIFYSKLGRKLFLCFLSISLIPLGMVCYTFYKNAYNSLYENTFNSLSQTALLKKANIINYYESLLKELNYQVKTKTNIEIMERLTSSFNESGLYASAFIESDDWMKFKSYYVNDIKTAQSVLDLQNIYFIDINGNVLFSAIENGFLGRNLFSSNYKDTSLSGACLKSIETGTPFISDIEFFVLSNSISHFIIQPVLNDDERKIGLMAFQVSSTGINSILNIKTGFYKSYEAYIIGQDLVVKSSSKIDGDIPVVNRKIETEITAKWLEQSKRNTFDKSNKVTIDNKLGQQKTVFNASLYEGYRGNKVLGIFSSLDSLEIYGVYWALVAEINDKEAFASLRSLSKIVYILFAVVVFVVVFVSVPVTKYIVQPIRNLADIAKKLADRDFDFIDGYENFKIINNEIGELNLNFVEVINSFKEIASICQAIALGDLNRSIVIKSGQDIIGDSINTMSAYLRTIVKQANSIANNDYSVLVTPLSDHDELGQAIFNMTNTLMEVTIENKKQNWYKSSLAELNDKIRGEQDITKLCQKIISCMAVQLNAYVGAIYLLEAEDVLKLRGSYAYNSSDVVASEFKMGEGLIGQAALERKSFNISNLPEDYVRIKSASGEASPKRLFIFPVLFDNSLKAVIELGSFYDFNSQQMEYIEQACEYIAISIDVAKSHTKLTELLEETQQQSEELQTHQNELKLSNETLKNITQELLNSEKQLKQQQEELKLANEKLEEKSRGIERKKEELSAKNIVLEKTKKELETKAGELEQISKYKSEFLANISHELRTPLNSLLILARDLYENESKNLTETQVESAEIIYKSGTDLLDLINDILDISKVEAGKMNINITTISLKEISDKINFNFSRLAKEKGLYLNISLDKNLPLTIETDPQRIDQIIKNLISNSIKFTESGGIDVSFSRTKTGVIFSKCALRTNSSICISIKDTGIGIAKDKQATIFEAFRQADGSTSRRYGGTGLGLSISQELALLLGGEIQVESEEGKGSIFTLYIPCNEDSEQILNNKNQLKLQKEKRDDIFESKISEKIDITIDNKPGNQTENLNFFNKNILIVDDDMRNSFALSKILEDRGMNVVKASNGQQAIEALEHGEDIDIVLMDIMMPVLDGYEAMKIIRQKNEFSELPIIALTAKAMQADKNKCIACGANDYISKPVNIDKLFFSIEKFLF